jgi:pyruvate dehydrogenase E2 component (dihydrolipoamide acetyltransferase)
MTTSILMPQVGQDLETGKLLELYVKEGDEVKEGDIVALVESEKASFEVEAYESGTVVKLCYEIGDEAVVLNPLILLRNDDQEAMEIEPEAPIKESAAKPAKAVEVGASGNLNEDKGPGEKVKSSPLARKIARKNGVDLSSIKGTGPGGRILKRDVLNVAQATTVDNLVDVEKTQSVSVGAVPQNVGDEVIPFNRMRQAIATALCKSKQTIPHFYVQRDVDVTDVLERRAVQIKLSGEKFSINDLLIKAIAETLGDFPKMNAHVVDSSIVLKREINIGMAVSVDDGLLVPVVGDPRSAALPEINRLCREYASSAKRGVLKSTETGTFTISNLGMLGVDCFFPIINPPEVGILGVGAVVRKVVEHNGGIRVRSFMTLGLACDHRAVDGAYAAEFLQSAKDAIENYTFV